MPVYQVFAFCALTLALLVPSSSLAAVGEQSQAAPPAIVPAPAGGAPGDAAALFNGTGTEAWESAEGGAIAWTVEDGALVVAPGSGNIRTREGFGDVQLHLEFRTPLPAQGQGQDRGNSGVFFMGRYELQILDSYRNATYADGQAAAVYKQYVPLVNASRSPGEWQTYDALFLAPRFAATGKLLAPARMTVFHNGVLVQHDVALRGVTRHQGQPGYQVHPARLPLELQDHGQRVAFRNIWIREIARPASTR